LANQSYKANKGIYIPNKSISSERVARLIADLEAHERFWYYLALFQVSGGYRVCR